jgi:DNA-binding CsgD family transcriptional regulator
LKVHHDTLARTLVDLSASSRTVSDYYATALEVLAGTVGFDNAIVFSPQVVDGSPFIYGMCPESRSFVQRYLLEFPAYSTLPNRAAELAMINEVVTDEQLYADLGINRDRDPFDCEIMRPCGITSVMDVAVRLGPHVFGFLSLHRAGGRRFSSKETGMVKPVAPALGAAVAALHSRHRKALHRHLTEKLSARELEVVELVARGLSNKEISMVLGSSPNTVRNQLHAVFVKLSIGCRAELVRMVVACG